MFRHTLVIAKIALKDNTSEDKQVKQQEGRAMTIPGVTPHETAKGSRGVVVERALVGHLSELLCVLSPVLNWWTSNFGQNLKQII